ncbi:hypothetical protein PAPYR_6283 [Paratrimastix pyriformis]|uniref:Uncharacterized protein n=1 Tax=Paratrimastix pyriformis TaxID=342808 RepID=A0ABQ8UMP6_9EUKA|nr:hypothetical protein PAPYR_6283 [Paratrimastix pyriformis]
MVTLYENDGARIIMGYSQCFTQLRPVEPFEWESICKDFRKMMVIALMNDPLPIQLSFADDSPALISDNEIIFNGSEGDCCESMVLQREGGGFQCVKTRLRPYDRVVTALLILADYHAPGTWIISSEGRSSDWQEGLELARTVQPDCVLPSGVEDE